MQQRKRATFLLVFAFICAFSAAFSFIARAKAEAINVTDGQFTDEQRRRVVPYRMFAPNPLTPPMPVIVFQPDVGGSVEFTYYLGNKLAENGYLVFYIQSEGTDENVWLGLKDPDQIRNALRLSVRNPDNLINRFMDTRFVINKLIEMNQDQGPMRKKMDLGRLGMMGQGLGARGTLVAAGEKTDLGYDLTDPRIKAGMVISPGLPDGYISTSHGVEDLFSDIKIPLLHVTGTEDNHPYAEGYDTKERTIPYQLINGPPQFLLVFDGATHASLGAGGYMAEKNTDAYFHDRTAKAAVMFFNAYLKGDQISKDNLELDFPRTLHKDDLFVHKDD